MAANVANATCPTTSMPDIQTLPIPQDINVVVTPGNDTSYRPMETCCEPNLVQIVDRCYLWCEIPERYFNGTNKDGAWSATSSCLRLHPDAGGRRIIGAQLNTAARPGMGSAKQIGFWVLALSGLIYLL
ncbi:hypothetical protein C8A00DRAFT_37751 [Chaetomidium leptoderma]|uniref:Uncharacterized protein n=1 Tax=Chaetomidium leptoderma TaxID=669021 RepID=A0AAN6ZTM8_9PEZI|nr:hypothetical protein C8A00DRAFT_37751 [Chaetomidium leptoderma]